MFHPILRFLQKMKGNYLIFALISMSTLDWKCVTAIDWGNNNWAFGCDFNGGDLSNAQVASSDCGGTCAATSGCTHFAWTSLNGGTCWMKQGVVTKQDAVPSSFDGIVCGVIDTPVNAINWAGNNWAHGCDFIDGDFNKAQVASSDCGGKCASTPGCTHFTWSSFGGGTCWLKQGTVTTANAVPTQDKTMVCGIVSADPGNGVGEVMQGVLATRHEAIESGACNLPQGSYSINTPLALGNIDSLRSLKYSQGLCGHILRVNCGHGPVDVIVSNSNLGSGLDLYASSWGQATGNAPPGQSSCSVQLTSRNPLNVNGARCYYAPTSEKSNAWSHLLGVFNTDGRIVTSATLDGRSGSFNGIQPYFAFNFGPVSGSAQVVFTFNDGSNFSVQLQNCIAENNLQIWS